MRKVRDVSEMDWHSATLEPNGCRPASQQKWRQFRFFSEVQIIDEWSSKEIAKWRRGDESKVASTLEASNSCGRRILRDSPSNAKLGTLSRGTSQSALSKCRRCHQLGWRGAIFEYFLNSFPWQCSRTKPLLSQGGHRRWGLELALPNSKSLQTFSAKMSNLHFL